MPDSHPGWSAMISIWQIWKLCRNFQSFPPISSTVRCWRRKRNFSRNISGRRGTINSICWKNISTATSPSMSRITMQISRPGTSTTVPSTVSKVHWKALIPPLSPTFLRRSKRRRMNIFPRSVSILTRLLQNSLHPRWKGWNCATVLNFR